MRELNGWDGHGEHRRHARDAAPDTRARQAHDGPKHAANDAIKLRMLLDPEYRKSVHLAARKNADATDPAYPAKHAAGRQETQEVKPPAVKTENQDQPVGRHAAKFDARERMPERQEEKQGRPERSRLPKTDTVQMLSGNFLAFATLASVLSWMPDSWEKVAAGFATAIVGNVGWANRRWKDRHGKNRPED
jgi:hypothetical protein